MIKSMRLRETDPAAKIDSVYTDLGAYCKKGHSYNPNKDGKIYSYGQ